MAEEYLVWAAEGDREAARRFATYGALDPFPDIPPALLNSADIQDYVRETGMFRPFERAHLKSASYEIPFLGSWIYWSQNDDQPQIVEIESEDDEVFLQPNDIAFVSPSMTFRIPDYIALRFNLRITHIHRGLLLGTGPLVDPGFEGRLLIPLHNLTANRYPFRGGEGLVWVEFTKLSPNERWRNESTSLTRAGSYREFDKDKKNMKPINYLRKAHPGPIRSIVPEVAREAQHRAETASKSADEAERNAAKAQSIVQRFGWIAAVGVAIALAGVLLSVYMLLQDTNGLLEDTRRELHELESSTRRALEDRVGRLEQELRQQGIRVRP